MRQSSDLQQHVWLRFSSEPETGEAECEYRRRSFLLEALEGLADLDGTLHPGVCSEMTKWLDRRDRHTLVESRIFEILAVHSDAVDERWTTRYLEFLGGNPDYVNLEKNRIVFALCGAEASARPAIVEWLKKSKHDHAGALVSLLVASETLAAAAIDIGEDIRIRERCRAQLLLHIMQVLSPDIFWDKSGGAWFEMIYSSPSAALADYPYLEPGNIAYLAQRGLVSETEAKELATLAAIVSSTGGDTPESCLDGATEVRRDLAETPQAEGLLQVLLELRETLIQLRQG